MMDIALLTAVFFAVGLVTGLVGMFCKAKWARITTLICAVGLVLSTAAIMYAGNRVRNIFRDETMRLQGDRKSDARGGGGLGDF